MSAYVEGIPQAEYAEVKDLSHQAHLEDTDRYVAIVHVSNAQTSCVAVIVCLLLLFLLLFLPVVNLVLILEFLVLFSRMFD